MDSGTTLDHNRSRRFPGLDPMSSLRPSLTFGSGFGVGRSAWGTDGSIWQTANRFTDGAVDDDSVADARLRGSLEDSYPPTKTGSSSLLFTSESEGRSARSNVPWDTTTASNQSTISRPQHELISPTRQRASDNVTNGQITQSNSVYRPVFTSSKSEHSEFNTPAQPGSQNTVSNNSRPTFERSTFPEFQPSHQVPHTREQHKKSSFSVKGVTNAQALSHRQGEIVGDEKFAKPYSNGATRTSFSTTNGSYDSHARAGAAAFKARFNTIYPSENPSHNSHILQFQSLNGTEDQDELFDQQENQLSRNLNKLGLDNGQSQWSSNDAQHQQPRLSFDSNGSIMSKARFGCPVDERSRGVPIQPVPDLAHDSGYQYLPNYYRSLSFGDPPTTSPTASEYRRSLQSPFYSTTGTPPTGPESMRSAGSGLSSRASNGHSALLDRKLRSLEPYSHDQLYVQPNPLLPHTHYPSPTYDYSTYASNMRMNPLANPYTMSGFVNPGGVPQAIRYPSREHDTSQIIRSPLLEDFRTNSKTNKRYELKDIYNHVVEFSGDQHGSRFIQQKLETANSDEKDQIFTEILPDSLQLMTDVFGNYVIQKLFEHGNQPQKKLLANQMKGHVFSLSLQMYGCRVVQKALEHILTDQQSSLVKELESHVLKCVKDQNGNHVIQKAIERVPAEHIQFIVDAFDEQVQRLATHPYGCRVIQRMLEHCERPAKQGILREMHLCVPTLITDQFGNYVIQHVIERGDPEDRYRVVSIVQAQLLIYSKHKFASNVVEKSIEFSEESQRKDILHQLTVTNERGESPVFGLMRDQYGNYVIQKVLSQLQGARRQELVDQIKAQLVNLKKFSYGKQITAIEKLIFDNDNSSLSASSQNSTLPSTNASTVEGRMTPPRLQIIKPPQAHESQIALPLPPGQPRA